MKKIIFLSFLKILRKIIFFKIFQFFQFFQFFLFFLISFKISYQKKFSIFIYQYHQPPFSNLNTLNNQIQLFLTFPSKIIPPINIRKGVKPEKKTGKLPHACQPTGLQLFGGILVVLQIHFYLKRLVIFPMEPLVQFPVTVRVFVADNLTRFGHLIAESFEANYVSDFGHVWGALEGLCVDVDLEEF